VHILVAVAGARRFAHVRSFLYLRRLLLHDVFAVPTGVIDGGKMIYLPMILAISEFWYALVHFRAEEIPCCRRTCMVSISAF